MRPTLCPWKGIFSRPGPSLHERHLRHIRSQNRGVVYTLADGGMAMVDAFPSFVLMAALGSVTALSPSPHVAIERTRLPIRLQSAARWRQTSRLPCFLRDPFPEDRSG
jgi:hypothetical protein